MDQNVYELGQGLLVKHVGVRRDWADYPVHCSPSVALCGNSCVGSTFERVVDVSLQLAGG